MPTLRDRLALGLTDIAMTVARVAGAVRSPIVAPETKIPNISSWSSSGLTSINQKLIQKLYTLAGYTGQISYDSGPAWTRYSSYPATDLTPEKIAAAQQEAISGYPLRWEEMIEQVWSRDSHLSGIGQQRVDDVVKGAWRLTRSEPDELAACVRNFCESQLRSLDTMEEADGWLLLSNAYCYAACEIIWKLDLVTFPGPKGEVIGPVPVIVPAMLVPVHAKHFRFDIRTDEPYLWLGVDQIPLPYGKFIFMKGEGSHPIIERRGYMWPCVWLSMIRSQGIAGWASWVERYGMPTPLLKYDGNITQYDAAKNAYSDIMRSLGLGIGAIFPSEDFSLDFAQPSSGGRSTDPHSALADACDSAQSVRILGATLTAKIGNVGSYSATTGHVEVKYNKEEHDARRLWSSKRQGMLDPMVRFNAAALAAALTDKGYRCTPEMLVRRVPRGMQRVPRDSDLTEQSGIVSKAINEWGMDISKEGLYDRFDLPQPISKEDVAMGKPQQVTSGGKVIGTNEASNEGAEAPKDPPASSSSSAPPPRPQLPARRDDNEDE